MTARDWDSMPYNSEKRRGLDRRTTDFGPPRGHRERRAATERRQTAIEEISYFEWASHFVKFHGKAVAENATSMAENAAEVLARSR